MVRCRAGRSAAPAPMSSAELIRSSSAPVGAPCCVPQRSRPQRQAVEPPAQLGDGRSVGGIVQREVGIDVARSLHEQLGGGGALHRRGRVVVRQGQRSQWSQALPSQPQCRPAGGQHRDARTPRQQRRDVRRGLEDLLDVVQEQQVRTAAEGAGQRIESRDAAVQA